MPPIEQEPGGKPEWDQADAEVLIGNTSWSASRALPRMGPSPHKSSFTAGHQSGAERWQEIEQSSVTPYVTAARGLAAIALYQPAFGAELLTRRMADDGKHALHATLDVFGTMIMLSDEFPGYDAESKAPTSLAATTFTLHVGLDDAADVDAAMAKAAAAGCAVTMPAIDAFWGMRWGRLKEPFAHAWALGAPLPDKSEKAS